MSGSRPLLAARTSSGEASKDGGNTSPGSSRPPGGRPKRTLIESACSACRRRKSRCDGLRPSCSRCQNLRTDCQYEAEEGESRWSALRRRNQVLEQERDQVRELFAFVQARPEAEAQEIFQRIRTSHYDDVFQLLRQLKEGVVGMPPQSNHVGPLQPSPVTTGVDRLPPIQTILNAPNHAGLPPSHLAHSQPMGSEDSKGGLIPELPPGLPPHYHAIEPSLRTHTHDIPCSGHIPSLSSEESTGSIGSTWLDPPKPYQTP